MLMATAAGADITAAVRRCCGLTPNQTKIAYANPAMEACEPTSTVWNSDLVSLAVYGFMIRIISTYM